MIPLEPEKYYHVFNHANGNENLFLVDDNYMFFLKQYRKHVLPVAEILAYCLMPNHFHLLVKIKPENEILSFIKIEAFQKFKRLEKLNHAELCEAIKRIISKQLANLFSSYTQAFNNSVNRRGSLFLKNFKRKEITSEYYFRKIVNYIHFNPVVHGFVDEPIQWKYSSYEAIVSNKPTLVNKVEILQWFDDLDNFIYNHRYPFDNDDL